MKLNWVCFLSLVITVSSASSQVSDQTVPSQSIETRKTKIGEAELNRPSMLTECLTCDVVKNKSADEGKALYSIQAVSVGVSGKPSTIKGIGLLLLWTPRDDALLGSDNWHKRITTFYVDEDELSNLVSALKELIARHDETPKPVEGTVIKQMRVAKVVTLMTRGGLKLEKSWPNVNGQLYFSLGLETVFLNGSEAADLLVAIQEARLALDQMT